MLVQIKKRKEHGYTAVEATARFQVVRTFSEQELQQERATIDREEQAARYLSEMITGTIKDQVRETIHKMMLLVPPVKQGEFIKHSEEIHEVIDYFFKPEIIERQEEVNQIEIISNQNNLIGKMNDTIEKLQKERDYWKLSFNKQVEVSRGGKDGSK